MRLLQYSANVRSEPSDPPSSDPSIELQFYHNFTSHLSDSLSVQARAQHSRRSSPGTTLISLVKAALCRVVALHACAAMSNECLQPSLAPLCVLRGHSGGVTSALFLTASLVGAEGGKWQQIIAGSADDALTLSSWQSMERYRAGRRRPVDHSPPTLGVASCWCVWCLCCACSDSGGCVRWWDVSTRRCIHSLSAHPAAAAILGVALSRAPVDSRAAADSPLPSDTAQAASAARTCYELVR